MKFDIQVLPLMRDKGLDIASWPGIHAAVPTRRSARSRQNENLVVLLHFLEGSALSDKAVQELAVRLTDSYFQKTGTITSAARSVAEELNELLTVENSRPGNRKPSVAFLSMVVSKDESLFLIQSGLTHGFLLDSEKVSHIFDPQNSGRGLGLNQKPDIMYSKFEQIDGMLLLLAPHVPTKWKTDTLKDAFGQDLGVNAKRFLDDAGENLQLLVIEASKGQGVMDLLYMPGVIPEPTIEPHSETKIKQPTASLLDDLVPEHKPTRIPTDYVEEIEEEIEEEIKNSPEDSIVPIIKQISKEPKEPKASPLKPILESAQKSLGKASAGVVEFGSKTGQKIGSGMTSLRKFFSRFAPKKSESGIPPATMMAIAIVVPIVVIGLAVWLYFRFGIENQYETYYTAAQELITEAQTMDDIDERREKWRTAVSYLEYAYQFKETEEVNTLYEQILSALDGVDRVVRVDYWDAISGKLDNDANIVEMVTSSRELFMLDANTGSVLHAEKINDQYQLDKNFVCRPGQYEDIIVNNLIAISILPFANLNEHTLVAVDENGTLLYCGPGLSPEAIPLTQPDNYFGKIATMTIYNGNMYVLDPWTNSVWVYLEDDEYTSAPHFFFDEEVPDLKDAIDIAITKEYLVILFSDMHIAICDFSSNSTHKVSCENPAEITDTRQGRSNTTKIEDATFFALDHSDPIDNNFYFLDPIERAVYAFGPPLNMIEQYRSLDILQAGLATSFTVTPANVLLLAVENELFMALLP